MLSALYVLALEEVFGVEHRLLGIWLGFQSWCENCVCVVIKRSEYVGLGT